MHKLTKIERFRISENVHQTLNTLAKYGKKRGWFIREAISEKMERDMPKLIAAQKRKEEKTKCPF